MMHGQKNIKLRLDMYLDTLLKRDSLQNT